MSQRGFVLSFLLALIVLSTSCSSIRRAAVGTTGPFVAEASLEVENEKSWTAFRDAVPANLMMIEGLASINPTNSSFLLSLTKGHAAYGLGVYETLYLDEFLGGLTGTEDTENRTMAIYSYAKAVGTGFRYLEKRGVQRAELERRMRDEGSIGDYLTKELDASCANDLDVVFFTAQAWGSMINLQKNNMSAVAELAIVKPMMDWVCARKPDIQFGACDVFWGAYEAGRPRMLGGDPEKGRRHFEKAIADFPDNLFNRVAFIQFYAVPMKDDTIYRDQKKALQLAFSDFLRSMKTVSPTAPSARFPHSRTNLLNAIAMKRFEIIDRHEKDIF